MSSTSNSRIPRRQRQRSRPGGSAAPSPRPAGDEGFAQRVEGEAVDTAHATRLENPALIIPQGAVLSAVLETGINSDLPGFVRAVVSRDVSGFDGSTVLTSLRSIAGVIQTPPPSVL